jgi:tetratricopeptide (TPR) repeat protein
VTTDAALGGEAVGPAAEDERWYLDDQREFLLRSIDDAVREHEAGDLATADFEVLVARDRRRLAEVEAALAALGPAAEATPAHPVPEPADPPRSRYAGWPRVGIVAACLCILVGAVILVDHALSPGLPGQAPSGSITVPKAQLIEEQLGEALSLNNDGQTVSALQLYQKVLSEDPEDPEALAASGWLEWNYGSAGKSSTLMAAGRASEEKVIRLTPTFYAGHLYLGLILLNEDHNAPGAVDQFNAFLADHPSPSEVHSVAALVAVAYRDAKVPIPAAVADGTTRATSTTATTTTTTTPTTSAP